MPVAVGRSASLDETDESTPWDEAMGRLRLVGARLDRDAFSFAVLVSFPTGSFSL